MIKDRLFILRETRPIKERKVFVYFPEYFTFKTAALKAAFSLSQKNPKYSYEVLEYVRKI